MIPDRPGARVSKELQIGKAGEYLVCSDLLSRGFNAFPSDQGLNYDVVVDIGGHLLKIQVKTTTGARNYNKRNPQLGHYRFAIRRGVKGRRKFDAVDCDFFAFVALDIKSVAYLPYSEMLCPAGRVIQLVEFKTKSINYPGRSYPNGTIRKPYGRFIEDHPFDPSADQPSK